MFNLTLLEEYLLLELCWMVPTGLVVLAIGLWLDERKKRYRKMPSHRVYKSVRRWRKWQL